MPYEFVMLLILAAVAAADDAPPSAVAKEPQLREELLQRMQADQKLRLELTYWMKQENIPQATDESALTEAQKAKYRKFGDDMRQLDEKNTEWLRGVIEKHGWPTNALVGKDGAKAAWLLVQHADQSPEFQRKCLDLMSGLPSDQISLQDVAYLTDRVLLAEGKSQLYATQFTFEGGKLIPRPLEDEAQVDVRRKKMGLPPLAEYIKLIESVYGSQAQ